MPADAHPKEIGGIGGSIAGLATSLALRSAGHHVHVLESDSIDGFDTPLEAKVYMDKLHETLPANKNYIMGNAEIAQGGSFEL